MVDYWNLVFFILNRKLLINNRKIALKLKIIPALLILFHLVSSQTITDKTTEIADSSIVVTSKIRTDLEQIQQDINELVNSITRIDSLLAIKANQVSIEEMITQFNHALLDLQNDMRNSTKSFDYKIKTVEEEFESRISQLNRTVNQDLQESNARIDELGKNINSVSDSVSATANTILSVKSETNTKFSNIDEAISKRTLYWVIAILIILLLVVAVFFFLKSKVVEQRDSLSVIKNTQEKLESEAIQLDTKLIQLFEQKLEIANLQPQQSQEIDHSLPIKLGEEIHRMRKRLKTMEESHGTKVLNKRIESLEEKLNDMGYEIINLEGKPFNEGMTVQAQFIPNEALKKGERIIDRVIKPQINFKNKLIQAAEVVVSQGV